MVNPKISPLPFGNVYFKIKVSTTFHDEVLVIVVLSCGYCFRDRLNRGSHSHVCG